jgi:hypothetical protein
MRDLANSKIGGDARRWASWFLEVADSEGQFFRRPIGHPALELVTENLLERRAEQGFPLEVAGQGLFGIRARHAHRAQLLDVTPRRASEVIRGYIRQMLSTRPGGGRPTLTFVASRSRRARSRSRRISPGSFRDTPAFLPSGSPSFSVPIT